MVISHPQDPVWCIALPVDGTRGRGGNNEREIARLLCHVNAGRYRPRGAARRISDDTAMATGSRAAAAAINT